MSFGKCKCRSTCGWGGTRKYELIIMGGGRGFPGCHLLSPLRQRIYGRAGLPEEEVRSRSMQAY